MKMLFRCYLNRKYIVLFSTLFAFVFTFFTKSIFTYFYTQTQPDHFPRNIFLSHQQLNKLNLNFIEYPSYSEEYLFSWPLFTPIENVLSSHPYIFSELYLKSHSVTKSPLIPMTVTIGYVPVFFNWISHVILQNSTHILDNLLVVAMDDATCRVMARFAKLAQVCFPETEFLNQLKLERNNAIENLFVTRIALFWLLSVWGFDILHFDVDAVPVKPNFTDALLGHGADLVAGIGTYPSSIYKELGATVCMGSFYLRSLTTSPGVRELFTQMKFVNSLDDQVRFNYALNNMGLSWNHKQANGVWHGCDIMNQLKVVCLPQSMICRKDCTKYNVLRGSPDDVLHVMHPFIGRKTGKSKQIILKRFNLWNFNHVDSITYHSPLHLDLVEFVKENSVFRNIT